MRIAVINLTSGGICGGYRKYLKNIIPLIARQHDVQALLCAAPEAWHIQEEIGPIENVKFVNCPPYKFFSKCDDGLKEELDTFCPDVVFAPVERYFKYKDIPVVTMLQNMLPYSPSRKRDPFCLKIKLKMQYLAAKIAVISSSRVIAVSDFVRDFLIKKWHLAPEKIGRIYYGIHMDQDASAFRPGLLPEEMSKAFLFTAGSIIPARGLEDLILAARNIDFDHFGINGIVIAGPAITGILKYRKYLLDLIKAENLSSRIIFLGELKYADMLWCYKNCRIFVMTSRVESFGMIGLEAMANGCLCVVADNPCLPEIFQECAVYYKPKDAQGLAHAVNSILRWEDHRKKEMSQKARARGAEFSWRKTADGLIREFNKAMG